MLAAKTEAGKRADVWTVATDDTKLTVGVTTDGQLCIYELNSVRSEWNWAKEPSVFRLMSKAAVDGTLSDLHWTYKDAGTDKSDGQKVTIRFVCDEPALELRSVWHAWKGPGPVRHSMLMLNKAGKPVTVTCQPSVDLDLVAPGQAKETLHAWYVNDEGGCWHDKAEKPGIERDAVSPDYVREIAATPGYDWVPIVFLDSAGDQGVYAAIEWSHSVTRVSGLAATSGVAVRIEAGNPANFSTEIPDGYEFEVPPALIGAYAGDIDDAGNSLRKYLFQYSMPEELRTDPTYPKLQWNAFTATGKEHKNGQGDKSAWDPVEAKYYPLIREAAALGFEEITVDVGWWENNEPDTDKADWPRGMKAAGDETHRLGMRYVLYWTDKEDMTAPGGRETRARRVKRLFSEYGADTWRSDSTRGAVLNADYWSVKGFYDMLDTLKKEVPGFQWENCSGGGPIKDYGAMKRATKIQICDSVDPAINTRRVFYDGSYALHPIQMQAMLGWHNRNRPGEPGALVYDFRSAALAAFMWWFDSPSPTNGGEPWTEEERKAIAGEVETYKTHLRPLIRKGDLYHIFPRPDDRNWDGIEYYDPAAKKGVVYIFKPAAGTETRTIKLRGVDAKAEYRITFEDGTNPTVEMTGEELADGISVTLKGASVSELMFFERAATKDRT